jgi:hypothetical protein
MTAAVTSCVSTVLIMLNHAVVTGSCQENIKRASPGIIREKVRARAGPAGE